MIDLKDVHTMYLLRARRLSAVHSKMGQVRDIINGDVVLPLPEIDENEKPAVANLLKQDMEQKASRIASTMPTVKFPVFRPGIKKSMQAAREREMLVDSWYRANNMNLKMFSRAKHMIAYACSPVMIRPHGRRNIPWWEVRDPVTAYFPELTPGEVEPCDVIFSYLRPAAWMKEYYPAAYRELVDRKAISDKPIRIIEYCDENELVLIAAGESNQMPSTPLIYQDTPTMALVEMERLPNRVGRCLATVPALLGLDRIQSELEGVVGMYQTMAKLMALETIGIQRDIWPETWVTGSVPGTSPTIEKMADPLRGQVGVIRDGRVDYMMRPASQAGLAIMDRLERAMRVESSIPAELGGESSTNIRTGRRGDAVLSAAIDFPIQMIHQLFEASLRVENEIAVEIDKAYFPSKKTVYISPTAGQVTYSPAELWESPLNFVQYSQAGVDLQGLVVSGEQRIGIGTLSKQSFMEIDPLVDDPESEHDRMTFEALSQAMLQAVQTRAAQDPAFVKPLARLANAVLTDQKELFQAYIDVDAELQQEQLEAQQGQMAPEQMMPGMEQPAAVPAPAPSMQNLSALLRTVRQRGPEPAVL